MKKINYIAALFIMFSNNIYSAGQEGLTHQNPSTTPQLQTKDFWKQIDELLTQDGLYPEKCLQNKIFGIFLDNKDISLREKSKYIEVNVKKLAPIFFLLNAVYLSKCGDFKKAGVWFVFGRIRMFIDQEKCTDRSVEGTTFSIMQTIILPDLDIGISKDDPEKYQVAWMEWLDGSWDSGLALHKNTPTEIKYPYWLATLGMGSLNAAMNQNTVDSASLFKPEGQWDALETQIVSEMQAVLTHTAKAH